MDLIVVRSNPQEDLTAPREVDMVIAGGKQIGSSMRGKYAPNVTTNLALSCTAGRQIFVKVIYIIKLW